MLDWREVGYQKEATLKSVPVTTTVDTMSLATAAAATLLYLEPMLSELDNANSSVLLRVH